MGKDLVTLSDAKNKLNDFVVDVLCEKSLDEMGVLLLQKSLDKKGQDCIDEYIEKVHQIFNLYNLLVGFDNVHPDYLTSRELRAINGIKAKLYMCKIDNLIVNLESNRVKINWLSAHLIPMEEEVKLINGYIGQIDEIGSMYKWLVEKGYVIKESRSLEKLERLGDLKKRLCACGDRYNVQRSLNLG